MRQKRKPLSELPEIDFEDIKHWLEFGDIAGLAEKHKISPGFASYILLGKIKYYKIEFLIDAMDLAAKNKQLILGKINQLKNLK